MKNFRFAIMGAGGISNRFCDAVNLIDGAEVSAVASKSIERAQRFAERNNIPSAYGSYREMLEREKLDAVYIGTVTSDHYPLTMLCLEYGVPVISEKAMFTNSADAKRAFALAEEKGVFTMEAMWSRFLPAIKKAKSWLDGGLIGDIVYVDAALGFIAPKGEDNRYYSKALGGGAAYDILVYAYELTTFFVNEPIENVNVSVIKSESGVDLTEQVTLKLKSSIASLMSSFTSQIEEKLVIYGTKGKIVIPSPHVTSKAHLFVSGKEPEHFVDTETKNGFTYEVEEVIRCVREGKLESDVIPHRDTVACAEIFDLINAAT